MPPKFPEGRYRGRVVGQALTESGSTPCVELTFRVTQVRGSGGMATLQQPSQRTIRLWLTEAGLNGTKRALQQLGDLPERFGQLDPDALDAVYYTGREVDLECVHREYEGQLREDWSVARPQPPKLSEERIAELDKLFGDKLKAPTVESMAAIGAETTEE